MAKARSLVVDRLPLRARGNARALGAAGFESYVAVSRKSCAKAGDRPIDSDGEWLEDVDPPVFVELLVLHDANSDVWQDLESEEQVRAGKILRYTGTEGALETDWFKKGITKESPISDPQAGALFRWISNGARDGDRPSFLNSGAAGEERECLAEIRLLCECYILAHTLSERSVHTEAKDTDSPHLSEALEVSGLGEFLVKEGRALPLRDPFEMLQEISDLERWREACRHGEAAWSALERKAESEGCRELLTLISLIKVNEERASAVLDENLINTAYLEARRVETMLTDA